MPRFLIEEYFARYGERARVNLTGSDVESVTVRELLELGGDELQQRFESLSLAYPPGNGSMELREAIAEQYGTVDAGQVQVFCGVTEAMFVTLNVLLEAGDHAVVVEPAYQLLIDTAHAAGAEVTTVPLRPENRWQLDIDELRRHVRPHTRVILVNFPNNPTGSLPGRDVFHELVELAAAAGATLISDEIYRGLELDPAETLPPGVDIGAHVVSLSGVSKVYGAPGARVGWAVTRDRDLLARLLNYRYWTTLAMSGPSEVLALAALRGSDQLLARGRRIVRNNLATAVEFMERHCDDIEWVPPRGGTVAFPQLRQVPVEQFARNLVESHGVLIAPASVFGVSGERFRLSLGRVDMADGLDTLGEALTAWQRAGV